MIFGFEYSFFSPNAIKTFGDENKVVPFEFDGFMVFTRMGPKMYM